MHRHWVNFRTFVAMSPESLDVTIQVTVLGPCRIIDVNAACKEMNIDVNNRCDNSLQDTQIRREDIIAYLKLPLSYFSKLMRCIRRLFRRNDTTGIRERLSYSWHV